jgi:predicted RNase H-like HicB family nuclease
MALRTGNLTAPVELLTLKTVRAPKIMKTYSFKVVVEPDDGRWHAFCPALQQFGAATCGNTQEEVFKHIHEVVEMIVAELTEDGLPIPEGPSDEVLADTRVTVTA